MTKPESADDKRIDGKAVAASLRQEIAAKVESLIAQGQARPGLAVILIGEDPASQVYVRSKVKACHEVGFYSVSETLPVETTEEALLAKIDALNADERINGILVQLPLPAHINVQSVIERISPAKDVDGFHPYNLGRLAGGAPTLRPCTPYGCMRLLASKGIDPIGKKAVVVGASNIVGRPMALELLKARATVTVCNSKTPDLRAELAQADIVVAAIGKAQFIKGEWLKAGAVVIDVGINRLDNGKLVGDVDYAGAYDHVAAITPVPGGVGPMTIACLLQNTLEAYEAANA